MKKKAAERVQTERLILRRPTVHDADAVFSRYAGDVEVSQYMAWQLHRSAEMTRAFLEFSDAEWNRWPAGPYLIESREDGRLLGGTGLSFETSYRASTGYILARDSWGQGYATEAVRAMVNLSQSLGVVRLYALCHVDHGKSARVLEKSGFEREGILKRYLEFPNLAPGSPSDVYCYARLFS